MFLWNLFTRTKYPKLVHMLEAFKEGLVPWGLNNNVSKTEYCWYLELSSRSRKYGPLGTSDEDTQYNEGQE